MSRRRPPQAPFAAARRRMRALLGQALRWLTRLVAVGRAAAAAAARALARGWRSLQVQVMNPLCCYSCSCAGVWLWFAVPLQLWHGLAAPAMAQFAPALAVLPDPYTMDALLMALALGLGVFREAYPQWEQPSVPLVTRMLLMGYAGLSWPAPWRKTVRSWTGRRPETPRPDSA